MCPSRRHAQANRTEGRRISGEGTAQEPNLSSLFPQSAATPSPGTGSTAVGW